MLNPKTLLLLGLLIIPLFNGCIQEQKSVEGINERKGFHINDLKTGCPYTNEVIQTYQLITNKIIYDNETAKWKCIAQEVYDMHEWMMQRIKKGELRVWGWCNPLVANEITSIEHHEFIKRSEKEESIHFNFKLIEEGSEIYYQAQYCVMVDGQSYLYTIKDFFCRSWKIKPYNFRYDPKDTNNTNSTGDKS